MKVRFRELEILVRALPTPVETVPIPAETVVLEVGRPLALVEWIWHHIELGVRIFIFGFGLRFIFVLGIIPEYIFIFSQVLIRGEKGRHI